MTSLVSLAAESDVPPLHENEIPMAHIMYGLIAMAFFLLLLAFLWTFRNTAAKLGQNDPRPQGSGSGTGTAGTSARGSEH